MQSDKGSKFLNLKKLKRFIFIIIVIVFSSCNNSKKVEVVDTKVVKKELQPFFDSDKVEHYHVDYTLEKMIDFELENLKSKKNKEFSDLFMGYFPDSIPKKDFEEILLSHNYKKSNLSIKQQKEIENITIKLENALIEILNKTKK